MKVKIMPLHPALPLIKRISLEKGVDGQGKKIESLNFKFLDAVTPKPHDDSKFTPSSNKFLAMATHTIMHFP